jgi:ankyrin repeat protein
VRCHFHYRKPLYFAVRENRLDVVAFLLDRDPDPTGLAVHDSLLEIARDRGYREMERLLEETLAGRHNVSTRGEAVAALIRGRDPAGVRRLLDAEPELVSAGDGRGNQPIHWAAMTRQPEIIDDLVARGADLDARRPDGARPIQLANGDYHYRGWDRVPRDSAPSPREVVEHLRARGAECDICTAAHIGDLARVRSLLDRDPTLANRPSDYITYYACSGTPLKNAAGAGHLEMVRLLLDRGADPNLPEEGIAPRGHALHAAVCNGHVEIVRLLLERGAHPNVEVESSADTLSMVISRGDQPLIDLLASHGAARAVHLLAYYGDTRTAAAVFGAHPALADDPEALTNAAEEGHEPFVRLMLHYRPDLPRRMVAATPTPELTQLLFTHGMDPNRPDWLGVTRLHQFARKGDVENAVRFLDHGADLHPRDEDLCSTPLGWAAKFGQASMVELLLRRGAKPNLPDDPPWATPLAWATRRGHAEIADSLTRHGAR